MLRGTRGFTVVQFIIAMTIGGLLLIWIGVAIAQRSWRDNQRKTDVAQVDSMVERYAANHLGRYPKTGDADNPGSDLQSDFQQMHMVDPKTGKYYVLGSKFDDCDGAAETSDLGPGYISYKAPGDNGKPYDLRICLEFGKEYYFGQ